MVACISLAQGMYAALTRFVVLFALGIKLHTRHIMQDSASSQQHPLKFHIH